MHEAVDVVDSVAEERVARVRQRERRGVRLTWALLNLVIGAIVTVLPLAILPFSPEQSLGHCLIHVVDTLGQVPLTLLAITALRRPRGARARTKARP